MNQNIQTSLRGVVANVEDCDSLENELELQWRY